MTRIIPILVGGDNHGRIAHKKQQAKVNQPAHFASTKTTTMTTIRPMPKTMIRLMTKTMIRPMTKTMIRLMTKTMIRLIRLIGPINRPDRSDPSDPTDLSATEDRRSDRFGPKGRTMHNPG